LRVESDPPGASVFARQMGQSPRKIGETPYVIEEGALKAEPGALLQISVEKDGFLAQGVAMPKSTVGGSGTIFVSLKAKDKDLTQQQAALNSASATDEQFQRLAAGVAQSQQMIRHKKYEEAVTTLQVLIVAYPRVSVLFDLLGNAHYMQRNLDQALAAYRRSQDLQANDETSRVIKRLEEMRGPRSPASGASPSDQRQ
jgi:tetratricopeptide (TPR) repeat protein